VLSDSARRAEHDAANLFFAVARRPRPSKWRSKENCLTDRQLLYFVLVIGLILLIFSTVLWLVVTRAAQGVRVGDQQWAYPADRESLNAFGGLCAVVSVLTAIFLLFSAVGYWLAHRK
jgi:sterol desaturase/sphingolipid hydroxylase (fatty acid hydroxylase superfamily)